jgi:hypothetical protein
MRFLASPAQLELPLDYSQSEPAGLPGNLSRLGNASIVANPSDSGANFLGEFAA